LQHIDLAMAAATMAFAGCGATAQGAGRTDGRITLRSARAHTAVQQASGMQCRRWLQPTGIAMRLFFATIAAALAALSGEIVEFQGVTTR
jgi:hypothetical protein